MRVSMDGWNEKMESYLLEYGQTHRQLRWDQILDADGLTFSLEYPLLDHGAPAPSNCMRRYDGNMEVMELH